ncbi:MAG: glutamine amidotransferase [Acidobacteriota bacterium]|nr:glutamine amidotransferase [Acidobacteriota bacterium]
MDSLFRFFFEYRPVIFQQGEFRLAPSTGSYVAAVIAILAVAITVLTYRRVAARGRVRDRVVLTALRVATLCLLLFCLFRPVLVVKAAVPQQNFLAVLIDDSRSMQIADWGEEQRGAFVRQAFGKDAALIKALSDRFVLRTFRFSSSTARLGSTDDLTFGGAQTKLGAALDGARQELAGLPLAGMVLVTDGADTTDDSLSDALLGLKAAAVPVFTVGVGRDRLARDVQVDRVSTPRSALLGTSLVIDAVVTQTGYAGETVALDVEDDGRIVGSQDVKLPADGDPVAVRVRFTAADKGARVFRFRIAPRPGELVTENNVREALIDVADRREQILYYEGEPRPEMAFLNRAVREDKNLSVVTLQRTADNKFQRFLEVDNPDQLIAGFPKTREELFAYRGLMLGSVEAGAFTGDQLRMISEFVERRGGGLLALGGPRAFAEGGYAGTPVAEALPVALERTARTVEPLPVTRLQVKPTRAGEAHGVTQIAPTEAASAARWKELPVLTSVNGISAVKPGATVLLSGTDGRREQVVLAWQRYGRGKALAFSVQDSWHWQMDVKMSLEDQTHENYWRQLLRWLVDGVPGPVEVHTTTDRVEPGEPVTLTADVVDPTFLEVNDARVVAKVTGPKGAVTEVPMQWTGERNGQYRASVPTSAAGLYSAQVEASRGGKTLGTGKTDIRAAPSDAEYFDATMHAPRLQRIADDTGGRFYTPETVGGMPEDLRYTGRGVTTVEERELWHMPIVLFLFLGLLGAEWSYRRVVGLA